MEARTRESYRPGLGGRDHITARQRRRNRLGLHRCRLHEAVIGKAVLQTRRQLQFRKLIHSVLLLSLGKENQRAKQTEEGNADLTFLTSRIPHV